MYRRLLGTTLALGLFLSAPAYADSIIGDLTVDNAYTVYVSTAPNVLGAFVSSNGNWPDAEAFGPADLTPGQNYWLQVVAENMGGPGGFLGDFTLAGAFRFNNGLQTLETNTANWTLQSGSFAGAVIPMFDEGANGVDPWDSFASISSSAHWIWDAGNCGTCTMYFSTPIIPETVTPPVPEPALLALLGSAALALVRRRAGGRRV